jgi:Domain of unknown function (DUF6321)
MGNEQMKDFKSFISEKVKEPTGKLKNACWTGYTAVGMKMKNGRKVPNCVPTKEEVEQVKPVLHNGKKIGETGVDTEASPGNGKWYAKHHKSGGHTVGFDSRKEAEAEVRAAHGIDEEVEQLDERGADSKGYYRSTESGAGLTRKGAKHFGIKTAVTTEPSKLKHGSKAWKRRKSFCARMGGMKGPMKDDKGRPTRKAMSLRRWHCEE